MVPEASIVLEASGREGRRADHGAEGRSHHTNVKSAASMPHAVPTPHCWHSLAATRTAPRKRGRQPFPEASSTRGPRTWDSPPTLGQEGLEAGHVGPPPSPPPGGALLRPPPPQTALPCCPSFHGENQDSGKSSQRGSHSAGKGEVKCSVSITQGGCEPLSQTATARCDVCDSSSPLSSQLASKEEDE